MKKQKTIQSSRIQKKGNSGHLPAHSSSWNCSLIQPSAQTLQLTVSKQCFNNHFGIINLDLILKTSFCYLPFCKTSHAKQITAILHNSHLN